MKIYFSEKFIEQYKLLQKRNTKLAKKLQQRVKIFIQNPHHPLLKTHQLAGKLKNKSAFWISWDTRIVFEYLAKDKVRFLVLGKHNEVYR